MGRASATVRTRSLQATSCPRHINGLSPRKGNVARDHHWQVVSQRLQFVVCLVDRRLGLCLSAWTTAHAFSVLSRIVSRRRVLVSINVQLKYNNIVTCKLPHRAAQRRQPDPNLPFNRYSSSPPSAPTTVSSFHFISSYIHIRSPSLSPMI